MGRINLTDLKSGSAWSTIGNSRITGTLGNVQVVKVAGNGGGVDFTGGIAGFSGILWGPNPDTPAGTVMMTFSPAGPVIGTIKASSLSVTNAGNWTANTTVTGPFTESITVNGTMSGNLTLNGTSNPGQIDIATMTGNIVATNGPITGNVTIDNFGGNICATNISASNVLSVLPNIAPGCTGGTFYGSWTCCGQTPTCPDTSPPTISIGLPSHSSVCTGGGPVDYTVTYMDANLAAVTLNTGHVTLNTTGDASGTVSVLGSGSDSPATRTVRISNVTGAGTIGISIAAGTARDASNNYAPAAGPSATFTVQPATAITDHPEGHSVELGGTAVFSVEATGQGTLSYRWQKDEANVSDGGHYSGATTDTLTVSNVTWEDAANYRCIVTGGCGSAISNVATLTVTCHEPRQDAEGDGDVDLSDFGVFAPCFNGPNRPYSSVDDRCGCMDNNGDGDVDMTDFIAFAACFNGPNRPHRCPSGGAGAPEGGGFAMSSLFGGERLLETVDVTFALNSDQDQQTISAGTPVDWEAIVEVTGSNQGLASFVFDLELREGSATGPLAGVTLGTGAWADSFAVAGPDGKPETGVAVIDSGDLGGPGMNALSSTGYNATPGLLEQVGAGYLSWDPWHHDGWYWIGANTWGVGLDARKEALLLDALGSYSLATGTIDTSNLDPGDYVLRLVPAANIGVLATGIDLNVPAAGVTELTSSVSEPVTIEFTIGAE